MKSSFVSASTNERLRILINAKEYYAPFLKRELEVIGFMVVESKYNLSKENFDQGRLSDSKMMVEEIKSRYEHSDSRFCTFCFLRFSFSPDQLKEKMKTDIRYKIDVSEKKYGEPFLFDEDKKTYIRIKGHYVAQSVLLYDNGNTLPLP
jgi:hypothetical protein